MDLFLKCLYQNTLDSFVNKFFYINYMVVIIAILGIEVVYYCNAHKKYITILIFSLCFKYKLSNFELIIHHDMINKSTYVMFK